MKIVHAILATALFASYSFADSYYTVHNIRTPMFSKAGDICERGAAAGNDVVLYSPNFRVDSVWTNQLINAFEAWDEVTSYRFDISFSNREPDYYDGINSVFFAARPAELETDIAQVYTDLEFEYYPFYGTVCWINESDMYFFKEPGAVEWTTSRGSYKELTEQHVHSFELTAAHEVGHMLGLHDTYNANMSLMYGKYPNYSYPGYVNRTLVGGADALTVKSVYGGPNFRDIAPLGYVFTYDASEVGDGDHETGWVKKPLEITWDRSSTSSYVPVYIDYAFDNRGTQDETINVGFYQSTNDIISTGDTFLTSRTYTVRKGEAKAGRVGPLYVYSPAGTASYLGFYVDYTNSIPESYEGASDNGQASGRIAR